MGEPAAAAQAVAGGASRIRANNRTIAIGLIICGRTFGSAAVGAFCFAIRCTSASIASVTSSGSQRASCRPCASSSRPAHACATYDSFNGEFCGIRAMPVH